MSAPTPRGPRRPREARGDGVRGCFRAGSPSLCLFVTPLSGDPTPKNMGQSKGQAASLEKQLLGMQARQPRPPKAPQAPQKGLPRLERMDTSDSLPEKDTRNSFTTTTEPLSTHPEVSTIRSKSRKSVAAA